MLIAIMVILILIQLIALLFVVWQFGVAGLGLIQNRQQPGPSEPKNSFAIFVCAHNEENAIPALLDSLEMLISFLLAFSTVPVFEIGKAIHRAVRKKKEA